jgi:hypothetical protein
VYARHEPDRAFLAEVFPRLVKHHRWWFADRGDGQPWRDGNKNGLLGLGSNYPEEISYEDRRQVAYYESHDDSPQWWHITRYNEKTQTVEHDTVERNCLYAMDAWLLAAMADELGHTEEAARLREDHARIVETINRLLWNPDAASYCNRHWEGDGSDVFFPQIAPDVFLSLIGKVATKERAEALRKMWHDPKKFAGSFMLPTISRDDPLYPKQDYWRGNVWPSINYLVYQGLKLLEWDDEASELIVSSVKMFLEPWRKRGECHENFLATTGKGGGDPHYTWGALLAQIAIEELVDVSPWHGLRFGSLRAPEPSSIERYPVRGARHDVELTSDGLVVKRESKPLFRTSAPAEIRHVVIDGDEVLAEARCDRPIKLWIGGAVTTLSPGVTKVRGRYG